jgi:hypothetical protein
MDSTKEKREKKGPGDDLLSHQWTGSIIGAGGLNFRVRNGIGWYPSAVVTRTKYIR